MLVKLRRDLFMGDYFFKARPGGVEIPDSIDGKPVVAYTEKGEGKLALPKDAVILTQPPAPKTPQDQKMALSELVAKSSAPQSFKKAMQKIKEDTEE
jgi:hypothetical protein